MKDKLFISKEDILEIKDVSAQLDQDNFEQAIRESQIVELVSMIGDELFLLLQNDFNVETSTFGTEKYEHLFDGVDYTVRGKQIRYRGLKPVLAYYAYARLLNNAQMSLTRSGAVNFMTEADVSESTQQAQIKTKIIEARAMAQRLEEDAYNFMLNNRSDYLQYDGDRDNNKPFELFKL